MAKNQENIRMAGIGLVISQGTLLLTWIHFNPSMDR